MGKFNFITTCAQDIAIRLRQIGFQEIASQNTDIFIFVNDRHLSFTDDIDLSKVKYSNKLFY